MFEDKTYKNLMDSKLARVDDSRDKREGSIIWDALGPNSAEDAQVYIEMDWMLKQQHGESAEREYLKKIAYDTRGLIPKEATAAVLKGKFDAELPDGQRFSLDTVNYTRGDLIEQSEGFYYYKMICETVGTVGNEQLGTLIPISYVTGLTIAELTEILIYGEKEEDTKVFRQRWRDSFQTEAFGGNKADYKSKIKKIDGVGGVKIERATNSDGEKVGGYVKCTVISSEFTVPSTTLITDIQTIIDPEQNQGEGDGTAPIGAIANIVAVTGVTVNITATLTYDTGYSFEALQTQLENAVENYFEELREAWESSTNLIVRLARIESAILDVDGVLDIESTMLNGSAANVTLDAYSIPLRGTING